MKYNCYFVIIMRKDFNASRKMYLKALFSNLKMSLKEALDK